MAENYDDIIKARESVEKTWLGWSNVHGVGIGCKTVNNQKTEEIAICVLTEKKLPENEVRADELLPRRVGGFPVDVVETPRFRQEAANEERYRPCPGGAQIEVGDGLGTVGGFVRSTNQGENDYYALSCFHVLEPVGEKVYQSKWSILHPYRFATTSRGGYSTDADAAIAKLDDNGYADYGTVFGANEARTALGPARAPVLNEGVRKYGRTTRLTQGTIKIIALTVRIGGRLFYNQFQTDPANPYPRFSEPGDSGSLVVSDNGLQEVIGLHAGGNGFSGFAAEITRVLAGLNIAF